MTRIAALPLTQPSALTGLDVGSLKLVSWINALSFRPTVYFQYPTRDVVGSLRTRREPTQATESSQVEASIEIPIYLALHEQPLGLEVELGGGKQINSFP